jgi:redox-sensitive bicupin YhaK (pirin superfamily)
VSHSEFNPSDRESVHLLQIWILPESPGRAPSYEEKSFSEAERRGRLRLVASEDGREGSVTIQQDARLYAAILDAGASVEHSLGTNRYAWLQVARGAVKLNEFNLQQGDGAAISNEADLKIVAREAAEILLFDLA